MKNLTKKSKIENELSNVNNSQIEKKVLSKKEIKESEKIIKDKIYKFDYELLSTDQLKSRRQTSRKRLDSFVKNIINYKDLQKDADKLKETINNFLIFYKEIYNSNNFEIISLRSNIKGKEKEDLQRMLNIIKEIISK